MHDKDVTENQQKWNKILEMNLQTSDHHEQFWGIILLLSNEWNTEAGRRAERGTWSNDLKESKKDYTNKTQHSDTNTANYWSNPQTIFNVKSIVYCHATIFFFFQMKLALVRGKMLS